MHLCRGLFWQAGLIKEYFRRECSKSIGSDWDDVDSPRISFQNVVRRHQECRPNESWFASYRVAKIDMVDISSSH